LNSVANLKNGDIMAETKWTSSEVDPKREYLAFTEIGERTSIRSYFSILKRARKVAQQLKTAKGTIAFVAQLNFLSKKMGMVAVFEDEKSLMEFAHAGQHAQCMKQFKAVTKFQRAKWSISGSNLPPTFEDAMSRIQTKK
jgi:hypothetical protein